MQLSFAGAGVAGEDVQDELGPVENCAGQLALQIAQLCGGQVMVEEDQVGVVGGGDAGDLLHLAGADERGGVGAALALQHLGDDGGSRAEHQFAELGQRSIGIERGRRFAHNIVRCQQAGRCGFLFEAAARRLGRAQSCRARTFGPWPARRAARRDIDAD